MAETSEKATENSSKSFDLNENKTKCAKRNDYYSEELFPDHKRNNQNEKPNWVQKYGSGNNNLNNFRCERNILKCIEESPLIKLMMGALKSAGCEVDLLRHVTCETCTGQAMGGYDSELKQVVICQNNSTTWRSVQGTLAHEFVHMFDDCRANLDFKNNEHLACTEIRAASLMNCSFLTAVSLRKASPINIAQTHKECVKELALRSMLAVRNITPREGMQVIDKVFDKCYADLEPLGRRLRRNGPDMERAYRDRYLLGYE